MEETMIHSTAVVEKAKIGKGTKIWHFVQVREGAELGEKCVVGKSAYIGKDVKIGNNVKIQNMVSVYKGVTIEDDVFVGPHVAFTNDIFPRSFKEWDIVPTLVKKGASIGANSTVLCGITIGEYAMIGAGSVVTKDVPDHALVYGNPASIRGYVCKCGKVIEKGQADAVKCDLCKTDVKIK